MSVVTILPDCKHGLKTNNNNTPTNSIRSMDSLYSVSGSKFSALNRRKNNQRRDRVPGLVPAVSEIKQRVISARLLRMKQLQNQIGEAHHRIAELSAENRLLKSLHKRQDSALSKYENSNAELPKLLNSHSEEVRVWQTRCRNLQRMNKELQNKIKQKDTIILTVTDQNKHLLQLNKDKNLEEREKLADRVKDLELRLLDKDNDMKLLARRLQLETKAFRSNLHMEQQKFRDLVNKIELSDYMLKRSDNGDKKSPKPQRQNNQRGKSPVRLMSKSATNLTHVEEREPALILPPCEGPETKKFEEMKKMNSPKVTVNTNVKLVNSKKPSFEDDEIDLTKNKINRLESTELTEPDDDDDITVTVRNGMNRARLSQKANKIPSKLTPMHPKNEKKKSSDDSELSDEDFQLFSKHNGTKMAHNARDLLEHKMHLSELESKMKQNSLDVKKHATSSSSTSSLSDHQHVSFEDHHPFKSRGEEVAVVQRAIRDRELKHESFLDEFCDSLADQKSVFSHNHSVSTALTKIKKLELASPAIVSDTTSSFQTKTTHHAHYNGKSNGNVVGGKTIDTKKKNELLAALKHIDNGSIDR